MQCRLTGGVAASDDEHVLAFAEHSLARPGAVIYAGPEKAILVWQPQSPVIYAGCANRRARDDLCPVGQVTHPLAGDNLAANTFAVEQYFCAEVARLFAGALGEFRTADALREPQIILDLRTTAGLSANGIALDQNGLQAFRGGIDSRAEPGRPGAVDRQIVFLTRGAPEPSQFFGNLANRRTLQSGAVGKDANG